jgi:hypothetical protein
MTQVRYLTTDIESTQTHQPATLSEKLITITFAILVAVFSILPILIIHALSSLVWGGTFEWKWLANGFQDIFFILLLTVFSAGILYFLSLAVVVSKLIKVFWISLEEDY